MSHNNPSFDLSNPQHGLISKHFDDSISSSMKGTLFPYQEQYSTTSPKTTINTTKQINPQQPQQSFQNSLLTQSLTQQDIPQQKRANLQQSDELLDELGVTTDSNIAPAVYNLWQSFASIFLPQSLALPPSLNPIALLPCAHIAAQLRPFDLILIRTPGMFYSSMRKVVEHQYDHVAIVLTQSCALHISPPFTRIIPVSTLLSAVRNPIILRPKLNPEYATSDYNPLSKQSKVGGIDSNEPFSLSSDRLGEIYSKIRSDSALAKSLLSPHNNTTTAQSTVTPGVLHSNQQQMLIQQLSSQHHAPLSPTHKPQNTIINHPFFSLNNTKSPPTQSTLSQSDISQFRLFNELTALLGTPYDSIKMYTIWGKLALNRVTNQPLTKIDSSGVVCTDAIINILCRYDFFLLSQVSKHWKLLNTHAKFQFNIKSNNAMTTSKQISLDSSPFHPNYHPFYGTNAGQNTRSATTLTLPPSHPSSPLNPLNSTQSSSHEIEYGSNGEIIIHSNVANHGIGPQPLFHSSKGNDFTIDNPNQDYSSELFSPFDPLEYGPENTSSPTTQQQDHHQQPNDNHQQHQPPPLSLFHVIQPTILHQLPISNLESLDYHRISAWSLNDLLQLTHSHRVDPDPKISLWSNTTGERKPSFLPSNYTLSQRGFNSDEHQNLFSQLSQSPNPMLNQPVITTHTLGRNEVNGGVVPSTTSPNALHIPDLPSTIQSSKQFNEVVRVPLVIDSAFEVIKPGEPIPIELIYTFCNQLTLLCANFVLRETTAKSIPNGLNISSQSINPSKLGDAINQQQNIKYNRHDLLCLVNPYYRMTRPSPNHPQPTEDQTDDLTTVLADSLYFHLLCKLPGMIPFFILQALKQGMDSLQKGKKYELRPEVLLLSPRTTHLALLRLEKEVNIMYTELVIEPHSNKQWETLLPKVKTPIPPITKSSTTLSHHSSQSTTISPSQKDDNVQEPETIGQRLQGLFNELKGFVKGKLFNEKNMSENNPDGLDPTIQSQLDSFDLKNDPKQHILISNGKSNQSNHYKEHPEKITQFPQWLEAILPLDLISRVKELVNIAITPFDGQHESLTNPQKNQSIEVQQHPFPSIKYLSSIPAPFLLYIWSLLKPIVRFYLLLTILSKFLPYLVYRLTATALVTIVSLPTNTISWLLSSKTTAANVAATAAMNGVVVKPGVVGRLLGRKPTIQYPTIPKRTLLPSFPRPNLIGHFQTRFITFVSAVIVASVLRYVWNSQTMRDNVMKKAQQHVDNSSSSSSSTSLLRQKWLLSRAFPQASQQFEQQQQQQQGNDLSAIATTALPRHITDDALLSLAPSTILQQYNANNSTTPPRNDNGVVTQDNNQGKNGKETKKNNAIIIAPTYSASLLTQGLIQGYYRWITGRSNSEMKSSAIPSNVTQSSSNTTTSQPQPFLNFLSQTDQSLAWLNDVMKAVVYVTTDTLGLRTFGKNLSQSQSVKEIKKQIGYVQSQWGKKANP